MSTLSYPEIVRDLPPGAAGDRLLLTRVVAQIAGYASNASLLDAVRNGVFPKPIKLNRRRCAWPQSVVDAHLAKLKAEADAEEGASGAD
jgi:predicted DNA-binding transcriptional regulator AlpA